MRLRNLLFVIFALALASSQCSAQESLPRKVRGGCAIIQMRQGAGSMDYSFCDKIPASQFAVYLDWLPDFLSTAFDNAERATCGQIRCAVGNRGVDLVLVNSSIANAGVGTNGRQFADSNHLSFFVTTGMADMTEAAVTSYLVQSSDPPNGLRAWLQRIDERANSDCKFHIEAPFHQLDQQTFQWVRGGAQVYYQFLLGHEFAHVQLGGPSCGSTSADQLKQESSCDKFAFDRQWKFGDLAPNFVVVTLVALAHYDSLLDDRLGSFIYPSGGMTFKELFPAADWQTRAAQVAQWWTEKCSDASQASMPGCKGQWRNVLADAKTYVNLAMPHSCTDTDTSRPSELQPAGSMANAFCRDLNAVISEANSDFKNIRGQVDDPASPTGGGTWFSNKSLSGGTNCEVFGRDGSTGAFYTCEFSPTPDASENDKVYSNLVGEIASCFPRWTKEAKQEAGAHSVSSETEFSKGHQSLSVHETKRTRSSDVYLRIDAPE